MKKRYLSLIPAVACLSLSPASADVKLEASLEKVAAKVDTDGTYLQFNKIDDDIEKLIEYGIALLCWEFSILLKKMSKNRFVHFSIVTTVHTLHTLGKAIHVALLITLLALGIRPL